MVGEKKTCGVMTCGVGMGCVGVHRKDRNLEHSVHSTDLRIVVEIVQLCISSECVFPPLIQVKDLFSFLVHLTVICGKLFRKIKY